MAFNNDPVNAHLTMDRGSPIGNSPSEEGRGRLHVKVSNKGDEPLPVAMPGTVEWDEITTTFPATNQDLFTYKKNGISVQTVLVTYDSPSKKTIVSIRKEKVE